MDPKLMTDKELIIMVGEEYKADERVIELLNRYKDVLIDELGVEWDEDKELTNALEI